MSFDDILDFSPIIDGIDSHKNDLSRDYGNEPTLLPNSSASLNNFPINSIISSSSDDHHLKNDVELLKFRLEKLEKLLVTNGNVVTKTKSSVTTFIDSITATKTIEINPKTVEICSIVSSFFIGIIVARTIYDRLWFVGGLGSAYWASGVVSSNTRSGMILRRIGMSQIYTTDLCHRANTMIILYYI